ncbi:hypothetical protein [Streptodolium elevatio]|uniref:Integral membrane protein n=1 Tax=Streptodolium elevatio TaxID=3157996 RepID=A0ABV3DK19_9ACTN
MTPERFPVRRLVRFLIRYEGRAMLSLWFWAIRRRHGVGPGDVAVGYAREQRPIILVFLFVSIVEALVFFILVPWPVAHLVLLVVDVQTTEMILAILAAQATRPHVVSESELRIRNGAVFDLRVPRASIVSARVARRWDHERTLSVANGEMALALSHQTNVLVQLSEPVTVHGWRGPRGEARTLRIYADDPQAMVDALTATDPDESRPASNRAPARSTATPAATRTAAAGLSGSE